MWLNRNRPAFLLLLCALIPGIATAQQKQGSEAAHRPAKTTNRPQTLLIGPDDGLSVISSALESRSHLSAKVDCSHLVHAIYERGGFPYLYVSSSDLYAGTTEFRRVTRPQPGDLVVWPGHVGIMINPARRSFFSALRSGLGVDSYDSSYWKERGRPRFYRYVKEVSTTNRVSSNGTRSLTPTALETTSAPPLSLRPKADADVDPPPARLEEDPVTLQLPRVQVIKSVRPTSGEVSEALLQALSQTGEALRGQNIFHLPRPLVIVNRFDVRRVKIKGDEGWAEVQISESASLATGQPTLKKRQEKQRWMLRRRDREAWEVVLPEATLYLSQNSAVKLLSHQLASMTEAADVSPNAVRQKAQLAQLLNTLLEVGN